MQEDEIQKILWENPWLIDSAYQVANINGNGREVDVGGKYVDLFLKDILTNRPVIVEVKKDKLKREDVGQILEYRALWLILSEEKKGEFRNGYSIPKLVLIGKDCNEEVRISANLVGIEVKTFGKEFDNIEPSKIQEQLRSWRESIESGEISLSERGKWIGDIYKVFEEAINEINNGLQTKCSKVTGLGGEWNRKLPFMEFQLCDTDNGIYVNFFEFFEEKDWPYKKDYFYVQMWFNKDGKEREKAVSSFKQKYPEEAYSMEGDESIYFKVPRKLLNLQEKEQLKKMFQKYVKMALEFHKRQV